MISIAVKLAAALIPEIIKSKNKRDEVKQSAKESLEDVETTLIGAPVAIAGGAGLMGAYELPLPPELKQYEVAIHSLIVLVGFAWLKYKEKKEAR